MIISDLPDELLEEILSRVPATSLERLRSTCKQWNALFKDHTFTTRHVRNAPKESMLLMLEQYRIFPMSINLKAPSIDFEGALSLNICLFCLDHDVKILRVFHCDGLLLCTTLEDRLVVLNPFRKEAMWVEFDTYGDRLSNWVALGYEKKQSRHIYKILLKREDRNNVFKIYDFVFDEWRVLDHDDVNLDGCMITSVAGVSLKGNTYWIAEDTKDNSRFLLSFDFALERFKRLSLPKNVDCDKMSLSVVGDKQLSLLYVRYHESDTSTMDIWMSNEIDFDIETSLKWSKSFTFDLKYKPTVTSYVTDDEEEEKKVVVCCLENGTGVLIKVYVSGENDESYREICAERKCLFWWRSQIISYAPSLVQVPEDLI